jgi:hypothetical protein
MNAPSLCVIVPALNEAALIGQTLSRIRVVLPDAAVIVSDGGSTDDTVGIAVRAGAEVIAAPRGRGSQCRAGAMQATSDWLLFLHADTLLPLEAGVVFREFASKPAVQIGTFRVRFADGSKFLNALAWAASRGDCVFTRFGDQGILNSAFVLRGAGRLSAVAAFRGCCAPAKGAERKPRSLAFRVRDNLGAPVQRPRPPQAAIAERRVDAPLSCRRVAFRTRGTLPRAFRATAAGFGKETKDGDAN